MRDMDLFLLSSDTEQLPIAMLEAMANGLPVLATRVGDVPNLLEAVAPGLLTDNDDTAFAMGLQRVTAQCSDWPRWGAAARQMVLASYTQQAMLLAWQALFDGRSADVFAGAATP